LNNNPVNLKDSTGEWPELTANQKKVAIGLAVIGACALVAGIAVVTGGAGAAIAVGALKGAITGATIGAASGAATNGAITYVTSGGDIEATKKAAIDGAADGFMTGAITGAITGGIKGAKTSSCNSGHCFVAGTRVQTDEGLVPIEDIQEGDYVLSCDPETGDVAYKRVLETYVNETYELIHLTVDHEEITTTHGHPFYVKDIGFVKAGDLVEGAILVDEEGNELHPQTKKWEYLQDPAIVYNFAVEDYHTYYVGYNRVLVHNTCAVDGGSKAKEVVLSTEKTHGSARNTLMQELDSTGAFKNGSNKYIGRLKKSYGYMKQIGRESLDGKVRWRLDFDPSKGVHYNIENFTNGKGINAIKEVIPIDISYDEYVRIIDLWN
jgi:hypothetical protein